MNKCCHKLWISPQINYDGRLLGCNINHWADFGNVLEKGLEECLNDEPINYAKEMLLGRREAKEGIPCLRCKIYKMRKENNFWIDLKDIEGLYVASRLKTMVRNKIIRKVFRIWP